MNACGLFIDLRLGDVRFDVVRDVHQHGGVPLDVVRNVRNKLAAPRSAFAAHIQRPPS